MFKANQSKFVSQDKYEGRLLTPQSFQDALYYFFHNGVRLLVELIPEFINKLHRLSSLIQSLPGYRFYGSSLFIVYDGDNVGNNVDVRLIDFARCVTRREIHDNYNLMTCPPQHGPTEPDHGYLTGLNSILNALQNILDEHNNTMIMT